MTEGTYCEPINRQEWDALLTLADSLGVPHVSLSDTKHPDVYKNYPNVGAMFDVSIRPFAKGEGIALVAASVFAAILLEDHKKRSNDPRNLLCTP